MTIDSVHHKHAHGLLKGISREQREFRFIANRLEVDRDSEVVVPSGLDVTEFKQNPALLAFHDHLKPIGRVASLTLSTVDGIPSWVGVGRIDPPGTSADADQAYKQILSGSLNGVSIGFQVLEWNPRAVLPGQTGPTYTKTSLLEVSLVAIPSCATCLVYEKSLRRKESVMSSCGCQRTDEGIVDWDSINHSAKPEIDWSAINRDASARHEVSIDSKMVDLVVGGMVPSLVAGVLAIMAQDATERVLNHMSGRID